MDNAVIVQLYDATKQTDREAVKVPESWNLPEIKMLYDRDFYADGEDQNEPPTNASIKRLARATTSYDRVTINIGEGWRLFPPGTWGYTNQSVSGPEYNQQTADKVKATAEEFKKWNTSSKLGWWGLPHATNIYQIDYKIMPQYHEWAWTGPDAPGEPYQGITELEIWFGREVRDFLDFTMPDSYYRTDIADTPDKTYQTYWFEQQQYYKNVSESGYRLPCFPTIMPRKNVEAITWFDDDLHAQTLNWFNQILQHGDGLAWWEGNHASYLNEHLDDYHADDHWIELYEGMSNV